MNKKTFLAMCAFATLSISGYAQNAQTSGLDLKDFNKKVKPGNDFYEFACGGWMKQNPLPAAYSRFGTFDELGESNNKRINQILSELLVNNYTKGSVEQKLSDLYKLAMDSVKRNKEGVMPVMPLIYEIEEAATVKDLREIQKKYIKFGYGIPLGIFFGADEKDAKNNILNVYQGGITLGEKEYYLDKDEATTKIREAYKQHIINMFKLFSFNEEVATSKMKVIMGVETELAKASKNRTQLRDSEANYNKYTLQEFEQQYPNIGLTELMIANGVKPEYMQTLVVGQPDFVAGADKVMREIEPDALKAYMEWNVILSAAGYLSDEVQATNFEFFGKTMSGRKEDHPRWKRATNQVDGEMGEVLGKMYVEKFFPAAAKERMEKLVSNLQIALGERIKEQTWMDEATKKNAIDKLNTFYVKVGYPNQWKDMSALTIDPEKSYYENIQACRLFWEDWSIEHRAGKPVDKDEWFMSPQTVNAYYNPTTNEICFPAGILQPPFFDMNADDAFNYGAIGVVIGHEMTHGFDDQGRNYDKDGNMKNWWTEADGENFIKKADECVKFFDNIEVLPGLKANGNLTLGENLADHGGVKISYCAFKNAMKNNPLPVKDGFTPEQRFFLAYAGVWAANITEEEIRNRTKSDPHSLGKWRVNGTLPHIDMWYDAFNIQKSDKLYIPKNKRIDLW